MIYNKSKEKFMSKKIENFLKESIKKLEKDIEYQIGYYNVIESQMNESIERGISLLQSDNIHDKIKAKNIEKFTRKQQDELDLMKLKIESLISSLASKKANLHWVEGDDEDA